MKNRINFMWLTLAAILLLMPALNAQIQDVALTSIEMSETTFEFGTVEEGTRVEHVFTFKNTGDEPLIISNAKGSCGCTVPQWPKAPIEPGDIASFTVIFNSKNKKGPRNQKVTLTANTNPAQTFVYLKGKVNPRDKKSDEVIQVEDELLGKDVEDSKDCIVVFPNPTSEYVKIKMDEKSQGKSVVVHIFSEGSQLMAQRSIDRVEETIEFNVSHFPKGTYFANIQIEGSKAKSVCFVIID